MKTILSLTLLLGLVASFSIAEAPQALAKAHDNGVADTGSAPQGGRDPQAGNNPAGGAGGVSGNVNNGQRGGDASTAGSANGDGKGIGRP